MAEIRLGLRGWRQAINRRSLERSPRRFDPILHSQLSARNALADCCLAVCMYEHRAWH